MPLSLSSLFSTPPRRRHRFGDEQMIEHTSRWVFGAWALYMTYTLGNAVSAPPVARTEPWSGWSIVAAFVLVVGVPLVAMLLRETED
jgi:hypothetical protein